MALPERCDVAVIGGGLGGLMGAALLARAGLDVCVLEAGSRLGGYLAGFDRGGYRFDTAIHWLNQCGEGGSVRRILDFLGDDAPPTPPLERLRRYRSGDHEALLTNDPEALRAIWRRDYPDEARGIDAFFAAAERLGHAFARLGRETRAPATRPWLGRIAAGLRTSRAGWPFVSYLGETADTGLDRFFTSPDGPRRFFPSEPSAVSCLMPIGWAYTGDYQRPPTGGSRVLTDWLARRVEAAGGRIFRRCPAEQILVERGRAVGLRVRPRGADPETAVLRTRYVVAACDLEMLYERLLPREVVPEVRRRRLARADLYNSATTVFLGLDRDPASWGFGEELVTLTRPRVSRDLQSSGDPELACLTVVAASVRDPSAAPAGRGTLEIYTPTRLRDHQIWHSGPGLERGPAYRDFKRRFADTVVRRVEEAVAPGLSAAIDLCEVATPLTYRRYSGNRDGAIMGLRPSRANIRGHLAGYATPLPNVFLGGQWAEYGGGVPGTARASANVAAMITRDERPGFFRELVACLDGQPAIR